MGPISPVILPRPPRHLSQLTSGFVPLTAIRLGRHTTVIFLATFMGPISPVVLRRPPRHLSQLTSGFVPLIAIRLGRHTTAFFSIPSLDTP